MAHFDLQATVDDELLRQAQELAAENKRLRAALAEYAMHSNWGLSDYGRDQWSGPEIDGWVIAERALQNQSIPPTPG